LTKRLGFIGIGKMGLPMASRLIDQGYELMVYDIRKDAFGPLIARGARTAYSPAEVASEVQIVLVSLPTPEVVQEVALGPDGLVKGSAIRVYIDMSTTGPKVAEIVANRLREKEIAALDAPVSGGFLAVDKGMLTIMVSGSVSIFEQVRPILEVLGKNLFYIGDKPGLAQVMKLINNMIAATTLAITCEGFVMGVKAGLDPEIILKVLNAGGARSTATEIKIPKSVLTRTFNLGFINNLMYKDLKLCLEEAEVLGVPMWLGNTTRQLWAYALSQGGGPEDYTTIIKYIETWAGVEVGKSR
jgi:2-hydroxy-3-oxopropionate reductase